MGWIVKVIDNGGAIGADPVSLRTTQVILNPVLSFQNKVIRWGYQRKGSRARGVSAKNFGQGCKTQARNQVNNLTTDNCKWHKLVDRKLFLVFILGNIFINGLTKSKSILIKTVHVQEI